MKKIVVAFMLFVCWACAKKPHKSHKKKEGTIRNYLRMLIKGKEKKGLFLVSFVGDHFLGVNKEMKLVARDSLEDANLFNIDLKSRKTDLKKGLRLQPWVKGKKHVVTYNAVGDSINIEVPIKAGYNSHSDATVFTEVIAHNASHPVYTIRSKYRNLCVTLDPGLNEYYLKGCSTGGNDLQTFRFLTHKEAEQIEARRGKSSVFDLSKYLSRTKMPPGSIMIVDKNGVLFKDP
ncbi:hypothetical protein NECID01_1472 [Nematocida sp. AWRm77]|nr:hypothetical protein NECID01_1472 [Nematocida sp. AWRm77]